MKRISIKGRNLVVLAVLVPLLALFVYVALRSGPLAPIPVTVSLVEKRTVSPGLFGIGTVEARFMYKIGPTVTGRVKKLGIHVGELVRAGQILGEMDPVDLDERILAQDAALVRAGAYLHDAQLRQTYAQTQSRRYEQLLDARATSEETVANKSHERLLSEAGLEAARAEIDRLRADRQTLISQHNNMNLIAPVAGLVVARNADPGTTVVAGQAVVEMIDPASLWINVRFDQIHARGLATGLPAHIVLRSQAGELTGRVLRVEPLADAVTEETLAKVVFDRLPEPLPSVGELTEVTVTLPSLAAGPVIPNTAIQRIGGKLGVWQAMDDTLHFTPVELGAADLDGHVQVRDGLKVGDRVVVYSARALRVGSRIQVVDQLPGVEP